MNHGYDDDDDFPPPPPFGGAGGGFMSQFLNRGGHFGRVTRPSAYDDYFKAFSVATMPHGHERPQLMYGGKIIMPPSALARLTSMDIEGPWTFQLRNPRNPTEFNTHAGVLEFIAEEGVVHLPAWTLNLNEGDPVRLTGTVLPKGKRVKIQAQSVDFLEVADAKAVLESALRAYSALSKGDIVEITYNSLVFEFLIMETLPEGPGISIIDTDLEVDFETPVGYVEKPRPAPAPIPTMADKLKIDVGQTTSADTSRPVSSMSIRTSGSGDGPLESFTGVGQSLSGRRVRGKGLAKKIEEVDAASKINRHTTPRVYTPDTLPEDRKVPAPLVLPAGKFFFGYKYVPFDPTKAPKKKEIDSEENEPSAFQGEGNSLRRNGKASSSSAAPESSTKAASPVKEEKPDPWASLGSGQTLSGRKRPAESPAGGGPGSSARSPVRTPAPATRASNQPDAYAQDVIDATMLDEDDFMFGEDYDYDDDDIIDVDSD